MKRALIATSAVLAIVLGGLVWWKFFAHHPPSPAALPAGAGASQAAPEQHEQRADAPPAGAAAAAEGAPGGAKDHPAESAPAEPAPAEAAAAPPAEPPAPAAPRKEKPAKAAKRKRPSERALPDDATAAAIFADRPAGPEAGDGPRGKTPRLPVLRTMPAAPTGSTAASASGAAAAVPRTGPRTKGPGAPAASQGPRLASPGPGPSPAPAVSRLSGAVSGSVLDGAGAPVTGSPVLALSAAGDDAFESVTDDDGFFLLAGMRPGRYLLFVGLGSDGPAARPARAIDVPAGQVTRLVLEEPAAGATVRVRALAANGAPLKGQAVLVSGRVASPPSVAGLLGCDAMYLPEPGRPDLLRHVPAGVYTLVLMQGGSTAPVVARQPVTVRGGGDQQVEVRFQPAQAGG